MNKYSQTLVLDSSWMPRCVISSARAFAIVYKGNARVVENHNKLFGLVKKELKIYKPAIIQVESYIDLKYQKVSLSRENIFKRDGYTCVYCGDDDRKTLTLDHVWPKAKGGRNSWENLVTACRSCNFEKSDLTLIEYGKKIPNPKRPHFLMMLKKVNYIPDVWKQFLFL